MRDPARIDPILDAVREAWVASPDVRLGQLIYNAARYALPGQVPPCPQLFYMEDGELLEGLREMGKP